MAHRTIYVVIAWAWLVGIGAALALTFPVLTDRVVDEAAVLDGSAQAALTGELAELERKTTDQLVVVTLKSLQGTTIEDYGYQLGRQWQIGQKDKNNGVLLIVVPSERKVRIEVGYGLEGALTDAVARVIIENSILPRFKAGDLPGGIKRGAEDIIQVLSGDAEEWQRRAAQMTSPPSESAGAPADNGAGAAWLIAIILLVLGFLVVCAMSGSGVCQGILRFLFVMLLSGQRGSSTGGSYSSSGGSSWSGGGGSFGGGGSSGSW